MYSEWNTTAVCVVVAEMIIDSIDRVVIQPPAPRIIFIVESRVEDRRFRSYPCIIFEIRPSEGDSGIPVHRSFDTVTRTQTHSIL